MENGANPISANKDLLVALPVLGSALAMTFDVGYFTAANINFFTVFSISEHIVFALEVLPLAILASTLIIIAPIAAERAQISGFKDAIAELTTGKRTKFYRRKIFWFDCALFMFLALQIYYFRSLSSIFVFVSFATLNFLALRFSEYLRRPMIWGGISFIFCSAIAFTTGFDTATHYRENPKFPYTIKTADAELRAKIVRSGERGILFYEEVSKQLSILPWGEIKKISAEAK